MTARQTRQARGRVKRRRCPACGQRVDTSAQTVCSLCGFDFTFGAESITGDDATPYARAYSTGESGWRFMLEWSWFAGTQRLKHLALMRVSAASRRFARMNLALLVVGIAVIELARVGWKWAARSPALERSGSTQPTGQGWIHVAGAPRPLRADVAGELPVDLWWNWLQATLGVAVAVVLGILCMWMCLAIVRAGVSRAHGAQFREEKRMTAALLYGTAWALPIWVGSLIVGLLPVSYIGAMAQWSWYPPENVFIVAAAVVAGFGVCMWWFWLVRLGTTAPRKVRARVAGFLAMGVPLIIAAASVGWYFGTGLLHRALTDALRLGF